MRKVNVTKTLGPMHFEDLDPHRFEDLVRELAYDFRNWVSIEATGRSGADDGFDIRAFEREFSASATDTDDPDEIGLLHPMDGRIWMFQCKRESSIGPKKLGSIITDDVVEGDPPYGYVLAAPANFSKKSYDEFRERLRDLGVMEFYLWGRAELEDMLHFPKNDRILFTFFGISLISQKRSRATELRSHIAVKNKLQNLLGKRPSHKPVLLRDVNDTKYPNASKYSDFEERPRWVEGVVVQMHPKGLIFEHAKYFALYDQESGAWDYTNTINQLVGSSRRRSEPYDYNLRTRIEEFVDTHPREQHATLVELRIVWFDDIVVVDGDGDAKNDMPHLYVNFNAEFGPFSRAHTFLKMSSDREILVDDQKRTTMFPDEFEDIPVGTFHREKRISVSDVVGHGIANNWQNNYRLYSCSGALDFLQPSDVVPIDGHQDGSGEEVLIKVTCRGEEIAEELLQEIGGDPDKVTAIEAQIGRDLEKDDKIVALEFKRIYPAQMEAAEKDHM